MAITDWLIPITAAMTSPTAPTELKGPNGSYLVQNFNGLINDLNLDYELKSSNFNAVKNKIYGVNTLSSIVVATLTVGEDGDVIYFTDARYNFGTNKLTLQGSGVTVLGNSSLDLDKTRDSIALVFDADSNDWIVFGTESSGLVGVTLGANPLVYEYKSANFNAVKDHIYGINTTSVAVTASLDLAPQANDIIYITDAIGNASVNNITINPGPSITIAGNASLVLAKNFECVSLVYDAANTNWVIWGTESSGVGGGGGSSGGGELVKVSATDVTAGYLETKLAPGANIFLRKINSGADEILEIHSASTYTISGLIELPTAKVYDVDLIIRASTLDGIHIKSNLNTAQISVLVNGTAVPGLINIAVGPAITYYTPSAADFSLSPNDLIAIAYLSGTSTDLFFTIQYTEV